MNNCIKEFANITRIQNIQLVRSIGKDKGWNIDELITIINSRDISYYKNLFDLVVEDETEVDQGNFEIISQDDLLTEFPKFISVEMYENNLQQSIIPMIHKTFDGIDDQSIEMIQVFFTGTQFFLYHFEK